MISPDCLLFARKVPEILPHLIFPHLYTYAETAKKAPMPPARATTCDVRMSRNFKVTKDPVTKDPVKVVHSK